MTDATAPAVPRRRRGLLLPLILIALGGLFLAANLGYLPPVSVRALAQLWPLLLILGGIEMILGRRDPYVALAVEILVIVAAVALVLAQPRGLFVGPSGGSTSAQVARDGARALTLRLDGGAGTYTVAGGATALVDARSEGGEITVDQSRRADAVDVQVRPADHDGVFGTQPPHSVDVRIASDVAATLRVNGGAGDFMLDLRDVALREARINTGASKLELELPKPSGEVSVRVEAGAATITIVVPAGTEIRVTTSGAILSMSSQYAGLGNVSGGFARSPTSTETAGYAAAKDRIALTIEAGASSVTIR